MKKNLLTLGLLAIAISGNAQITGNVLTYVGGDALLTVQDQALVYSGGGWQNAVKGAANTTGGVVNVTGDIMVVGDGTNDKFDIANTNAADPSTYDGNAVFRLVYDLAGDATKKTYGQLYISGIPQAKIAGKVIKEYYSDVTNNASSGTNSGQQQIGLPFYRFTTTDLKAAIDPANNKWLNLSANFLNSFGRFSPNSVFRFNNTLAVFDQILDSGIYMSANSGASPTDYYAIPVIYKNGTQWWFPATVKTNFTGIPVSDQETFVTQVPLYGAANGVNFGTNGSAINMYQERYNTYLNDPFRTGGYGGSPAWASDYGKNLYQYSNPFLTNLDLSVLYNSSAIASPGTGYIPVQNLEGVAFYLNGSNTYKTGVGSKVVGPVQVTTVVGGKFALGDLNLLFKPLGSFLIKLSSAPGSNQNLNFANNLRVFTNAARTVASINNPTTSRTALATTTNTTSSKIVVNAGDLAKQVAVVLYDETNTEIGRTYYGVVPSALTGAGIGNFMQAYNETSPIYTSEELLTGGADPNLADKLYINVANEVNFSGKELPMTIVATNGSHLKFEVYEDGARVKSGGNISNGHSFYIEKDNVITKINDGDTFPTATAGSYKLYYDRPQSVLNTNGVKTDQTIIGKYNENYMVRFATSWTSAKIEVYSAAGQLLYSKANVPTTSDFLVPLNNTTNGLYIIKATSEKGEVVIKKILK